MLVIVEGRQRSGKSFYVVLYWIYETLRRTKRVVCTNVPLFPDVLCKAVAARTGEPVATVRARLRLHTDDQVARWYDHVPENALVVYDELYRIFAARELLRGKAYTLMLEHTREHGHAKLDLVLISHKRGDLDKTIRDGMQERIYLTNTRYLPMFRTVPYLRTLFAGVMWPIQAFECERFLGDEITPFKSWWIFPWFSNKRVFKWYNSFSMGDLRIKKEEGADSENQSSSDVGVSGWRSLLRALGDNAAMWVLCVAILAGGPWLCVKFWRWFRSAAESAAVVGGDAGSVIDIAGGGKTAAGPGPAAAPGLGAVVPVAVAPLVPLVRGEGRFPPVVMACSSMLRFVDGTVWRKQETLNGWVLNAIGSEKCTVTDRTGRVSSLYFWRWGRSAPEASGAK